MDVVLGVDIGTTNIKVTAIGEDGQAVGALAAPTPSHPSPPGVTEEPGEEFDPEELFQTCAGLIRGWMAQYGAVYSVRGIAVTSFGEAGVLLDDRGEPITSIIAWHDPRTVPYVDWWRAHIPDADLYRITGLGQRHIFSANKLLWYRDHATADFARARSWACVADWITFRLTGQLLTSYPMACRTMLFDLRRLTWSKDLMQLAKLPQDLFPEPHPSGYIAGQVTAQAAAETGLPSGLPVALAGHDHPCAALAAGVTEPGQVLDSSGTVEALLVTLDKPVLDHPAASGIGCGCHAARDRYYMIGGLMSGAIVDWAARLLGGDDSPDTIRALTQSAAASPLGAREVWFQPYLDGAGSYLRDTGSWGAWLGLRLHHSRADLMRALMEGLTFGIRRLAETMEESSGIRVRELRAVGGGTRNTWWQQLKADVLGVPIETPAVSDVAAQGAALLAGIGVGLFSDQTDAIRRTYRPGMRYQVNTENHTLFQERYAIFQNLYPALKSVRIV